MKYYKVLVNGRSCHGGDKKWKLPQKVNGVWKPSGWHRYSGELEMCESGLHITTDYTKWLKVGCQIFACEPKGIVDKRGDKVLCKSVRLLKQIRAPKWWINTERFILKDIPKIPFFKPQRKLRDSKYLKIFEGNTWDAARVAARDTARGAVWDAAWDATWDTAGDAAWDALDAARVAAWDAARNAAWTAARGAALDAAGDAAWAARDAAWTAARGVARDVVVYCAVNVLCADLKIPKRHRDHVSKMFELWKLGYGVYGDIDGVIYVYRKK